MPFLLSLQPSWCFFLLWLKFDIRFADSERNRHMTWIQGCMFNGFSCRFGVPVD